MKPILSIWAGKLAKTLSQIKGGSGSALPGVVGLKIAPDILGYLGKQIPLTIFVTGTNGKTTTCQLLSQMFREDGKRVLSNAEGANMITGVTAAMINQATFFGKLPFDVAILEVDEASLPKISKQIRPQSIIVTNFFRDQLDRYGEIDVLISHIKQSVTETKASLILNTDDPFVMRLDNKEEKPYYFGIQKEAYSFSPYEMSESKYCPCCQNELVYDTIHYGQLGIYACACGFKREEPDTKLVHMKSTAGGFRLNVDGKTYDLSIQGAYNAYNALAAIACARVYHLKETSIVNALVNYRSQNGRMEELKIKGSPVIVNLIKNPAGANATISEIEHYPQTKQVCIFLNDLAADGKDISWIWDVDFEKLNDPLVTRLFCSGIRAEDMALRLKYAGIDESKIEIESNIEIAIDRMLDPSHLNYLIPTYTNLEKVTTYLKENKNP